ncbi:preprotein translocase SecA [Pseudoclavibacter endophyticus]|nr:preprotein translocase SecA [Pseudoclavibacter endophyticus]
MPAARLGQTGRVKIDDTDRCPCLSGDPYGRCCGLVHRGERVAPTAEALMRSRYSAFVALDGDYLKRSWHPSTRPGSLSLDPDTRCLRLDIVRTWAGGPFDDAGEVEFRAIARDADGRYVLHEVSTFTREGGEWFYVDGVQMPGEPGQPS